MTDLFATPDFEPEAGGRRLIFPTGSDMKKNYKFEIAMIALSIISTALGLWLIFSI